MYSQGCCSMHSHLITSYVDVLAGKQLQHLFQDRFQEAEGSIISLHENWHLNRISF